MRVTTFFIIALMVSSAASMQSASSAASSFCQQDAEWHLAWFDDFDGDTINASSWNVVEGTTQGGACREAYCDPRNVVVRHGRLTLTSNRSVMLGHNFTTGAVTTRGKQQWSYAPTFRLCVSAILPGEKGKGGQGLWPAIWMMPDSNACDPDQGEMDILEEISGQGVGYGTYHWETTYPKHNCSFPNGHQRQYGTHTLPDDWNTQFHEYAVEHGESFVAYVYDGKVILNATKAHSVPVPLFWPEPFYLIINTAVGGAWPGSPNASTVWPAYHHVDYVRVVTKA
jgi:beta-glucanase (GH16 family)